jgi:hypothetical protein
MVGNFCRCEKCLYFLVPVLRRRNSDRYIPPGAFLTSETTSVIVSHFFGQEGIASTDENEVRGSYRAIECLTRENAEAVAPTLLPLMEKLLDRSEAQSLSLADLRIFQTPEGTFPHTSSSPSPYPSPISV